jgi:hypothetical protein
MLEYRQPLPAKSGIFFYAQEQFRKQYRPAGKMLSLISCFDERIGIHAGVSRHRNGFGFSLL